MRLFTAAALWLAAGCTTVIPRPPGAPGGVPDTSPPAATTATKRFSLSSRTVHAKEEPATLIALDGSRCVVSETRYRKVKVGDDVICAWTH